MKRRKQFVSPRVLGQVEVCLEGDLLVVNKSTEYSTDVIIPGIEVVETDLSDSEQYELHYD